jgi:hypothetical protein
MSFGAVSFLRSFTLPFAKRALSESISAIIRSIFVDSVGGLNANSGLTAALQKQTLAGVTSIVLPADKLVLARGSSWRETFSPPASMSIAVGGAGAMPILDGADVAPATWTVTGTADVWTQSWTRNGPIQGSDDLGLWAGGVRPLFGTGIVDIGTNGGWWVDAPRALTANVYVKVAASTSPNTNGVVYEISKRDYGFDWYASGFTVNLVGPVEVMRAVAHYNAVSGGAGTVSNLFLRDGNIHHMVTQGSSTTDCIATEYLVGANGIPFVSYRASGVGFSHVFTRCSALFPGGNLRVPAWQGFYSHASLGNTLIDAATWNGCVVRGMDAFQASAVAITGDGCYSEDSYAYSFDLTGATTNLTRCMSLETIACLSAGGTLHFRNSNPGGQHTITDFAGFSLKGAAFTDQTPTGSGFSALTNCSLVTRGGNGISAGAARVNYCVIDAEGRPVTFVDAAFSGNNNVFFSFSGNPTEPYFYYNGALISGGGAQSTLLLFQTASSSNANSVYTTVADQTVGNANAFWLGVKNSTGGPAVGDFRINPTCRVYDANKVARTGTFPDGTSVTLAGPQTHRNFNTYASVAGPPISVPVLQTTIVQMRATVDNPASWTY